MWKRIQDLLEKITSQKNNKGKHKPKGNDKMSLVKAYGPLISSQSFQLRWYRAEMKYVDLFLPTIAAGAVLDQVFRANSAFDPDRTGVGHQPRGFDQLTPQYNRYRVNKLSWFVEFTGAANAYNVCVLLVNGAQNYTTMVDAGETNRRSPVKGVTSGGNTIKCSGSCDLWIVNGRSNIAYHTDDTTGALVTTSPVETIDFHVVLQNPTLVSVIANYTVTLIMDVIFYDQIIPGIS